jgi:hypothetical protein
MDASRQLQAVKVVHTVVWAVLAGSIVALLGMALVGTARGAVLLSVMVWLEIAVLALNGWKCPLTSVAERLTDDRSDTFDIFLPAWVSRNNRWIFGPPFFVAQAILLARWLAA